MSFITSMAWLLSSGAVEDASDQDVALGKVVAEHFGVLAIGFSRSQHQPFRLVIDQAPDGVARAARLARAATGRMAEHAAVDLLRRGKTQCRVWHAQHLAAFTGGDGGGGG